jgi:beta-lactam-binding protein with PASTA domain
MSSAPQGPRRRRPRQPSRRAPDWLLYLPILSVFLFVVTIGTVVWAVRAWLTPASGLATVPALAGMPLARAQALAARAGLGVRVIAHHADFHAVRGTVIGQLPASGERVRAGRIVDLIVSDGAPMVRTPNLSNLSLRDARVAIENAHLVPGEVTRSVDESVVAGQVIGQRPDPLTLVPAGSRVSITVASGRPRLFAPNFIGMPVDAVRRAARDVHVAVGTVTQLPVAPGAPPAGVVVAQNPQPGRPLAPAQKIDFQVSGGPPASAPTPAASGGLLPTASPAASGLGASALPSPDATRVMRISVALPQSAQAEPVRVVLEDASGSRTIFDQNTRGGVTISFQVTVVGQGTVETYVRGKLVSSTPL